MSDTPGHSAQIAATPRRRVLLANPRGFCAGVERAIDAVEQALRRHGAPVFVRRAIVHNRHVIERLEQLGAVFVQEVEDIPERGLAILSAHGSASSVKAAARRRNLRIVDAICPLVAKVHAEVNHWYRSGRHILLIGHQGHPEILGTIGQVPAGAISVIATMGDLDALDLAPNSAVAYAVQTTFAMREAADLIAAITSRFADCAGPRSSDICYATTNRQDAIEKIAAEADLVLVAGDPSSSNARRLVEVARAAGCPHVYLVSDLADLPREQIAGATTIGVTAAASTPESFVSDMVAILSRENAGVVEVDGITETTRFKPVSLDGLAGLAKPDSLGARLEQVRSDIDLVLGEAISSSPSRSRRLADAMRYAVMERGKRFRAILVLAVADLVGGSTAQALRIGAAIECVHAQSLVHDDLPCMDDDDLRRGQPTLHRKFDEATALLAGDALLALAFEILADPRTHPEGTVRADLVLALARALGQDGLAGGQMMDLFPPAQPTADELLACEARKTGALIRYAVGAGARLGTCSHDEQRRLMQFAENLGLVFQIRDDVLDHVGEQAVVGKAVRKDAAGGRKTAAVLWGAQNVSREASRLEGLCHEALSAFGVRAGPLRDLARFAVERTH